MSSNQTTNYQLHKWEPTDDFLREEFNENFSLLDGAARFATGIYVGDGGSSRSFYLGFHPKAVLLTSLYNLSNGGGMMVDLPWPNNSSRYIQINDTGFTATHVSSSFYCNGNGAVYGYIAFR